MSGAGRDGETAATRAARRTRGAGPRGLVGRRGLAVCALLVAASAACRGPGERAERELDVTLPDAWARAADTAAGHPVDVDWWRDLVDEDVEALVEEALAHNVDLRAVAARLLAADAAARVEGAAALPTADLSLSRDRAKRNFIGFPVPGGDGEPASTRATVYQAGLAVQWELDVWGRLASREAAAGQDTLAAWADLAAARVALVAEVLQAWFALVEADRQVALAEDTRRSWEDSVALVLRRYEGGLRPALDVRLATAELERARAEVSRRGRARAEAARRLELLLGRHPAGELAAAGELVAPPDPVPADLPATLLARRADLFAAERRLAAAELRVDAARADFYPRLSLTGQVGASSDTLSDVLGGDFGVWQLLGRVVQPVFEGGRLRAAVDLADARAEEALAGFAGDVLDALAEVEAALDDEARLAEEAGWRARVADEAHLARDLARRRYAEGLTDVTTLLDSQRTAYVADAALLAIRRLRLDARIRLHLALGGGFRAGEAPAPADAAAGGAAHDASPHAPDGDDAGTPDDTDDTDDDPPRDGD